MPDIQKRLREIRLREDLLTPEIVKWWPRPVAVKILVVCEGLPFDSSNGFSFKLLIDTLRDDAAVPYANFRLTLAQWAASPAATVTKNAAPGPYQATYSNYRFASHEPGTTTPILSQFDEVWLFGISPNDNFSSDRAAILANAMCPTQGDLQALSTWMDGGGGVLAMGDHASLGAYLCARIPRVWTMRRWTTEDGAPPRIGVPRVDTNRPMRADQDPTIDPTPAMIQFEAQSDDVPQPLDVKRYPVGSYFTRGWRPHPILCGGRLGVIDVMPDHPHEGWIRETGEIDLGADVLFPAPTGVDSKEYPTVAGVQPEPEVIAWGNTLSDPPHFHEKGDSDAKRFGLIGAYDGHQIDIGRVCVDSTWHHWMSINLSGVYEPGVDDDPATPGHQALVGLREAGGANLQKILTYYRNVAVWLAPKAKQQSMLGYLSFFSAFSTLTFEDWRRDTPLLVLGREGRDVLGRATSDCFVGRWIFELIPWREYEIPRWPEPPCLSCPPIEWIGDVAIGTLLQGMIRLRDELLQDRKQVEQLGQDGLEAKIAHVFQNARHEATSYVVEELQRSMKRLDAHIDGLRSVATQGKACL